MMSAALNQVDIQLQFLRMQCEAHLSNGNDEFARLTFEYANMVVEKIVSGSAVVNATPLKEYLETVVVPLLRSFGDIVSKGRHHDQCLCCWRSKIECLKYQFDKVDSRYAHLVRLDSRAAVQPTPRSRNPFVSLAAGSSPPSTDHPISQAMGTTPGSTSVPSTIAPAPFSSLPSTTRRVVTNNARNSYNAHHSVHSIAGNTHNDNTGSFYSQCTVNQFTYYCASPPPHHP